MYFENMKSLKSFIIHLDDEFKKQADELTKMFLWFKATGEPKTIYDTVPYEINQKIRMMNQSKKGYNYILKTAEPIDPLKTLIRLYNGAEGRTLLKPLILKPNKKTAKSSKIKSSKNEISTNETSDFIKVGKTLMSDKNLTYDDLKTLPEYLQYLHLIPNDFQPIDIYKKVGFSIAGAGGSETEYRNWSKLSNKYCSKTGGANIDNFNKFDRSEIALKTPYLKLLAKEAHPEYFDKGMNRLRNYYNPDFTGIRIIEEHTRYITGLDDEINEKLILVKAQLGGGKTEAIKRLMEREQYKRVLCLSPRIAFSEHISKEFNFVNYKDGNYKADKLTISIESLYKLKHIKPYDLIIMDESEAVLSIFSSFTIGDKATETFNLLTKLINTAQKVILAGAFITQKTIDFINSINTPAVCIWNKTPPEPKRAVQYSNETRILKLIESIQKGEKNYCVYSTFTQLQEDKAILKGINNPIINEVLKTALIYSRTTDDTVKTETLRNINTSWKNTKLIMTTPTITVGNSYKPAQADFSNIWIFGVPTCIVADIFQSSKRPRETINNILYFTLPVKKSLDTAKRDAVIKFKVLDEFDETNEAKIKLTYNTINDLILKINKNPYGENTEYLKHYLTVFDKNNTMPPALKKLKMFNFSI